MNELTGAKIGKKIVTLSLFSTMSIVGVNRFYGRCSLNDPSKNICLTTKIESMVFGVKKALEHQAHDLEKMGATNIKYSEKNVIDILPEGYLYLDGKGITYATFKEVQTENDGRQTKEYILPEGYSEVTLETGEVVGEKIVEPNKKEIGNSITYDINRNGIITTETWAWNEEKKDFDKYELTKSIGDYDLVTFCDSKNNLTGNYIYVPNNVTEVQPVRYLEHLIKDDIKVEMNDKVYRAEKYVVFYTEDINERELLNAFSGHLYLGDVMKLTSQDNHQTVFTIYIPMVKKMKLR